MAIVGVSLAVLGEAWAQEPASSRDAADAVTFVAANVPLRVALEALIDRTRIDLVYDNERVAGRTSTCRAERAPLEAVLACVLAGTGLDFVRLSSGTYALVDAAAVAPRRGGLVGAVVDASTGAPLADAHVVFADRLDGEPVGTTANAAGRFALAALVPGPRRLVVSHVGYRPAAVEVRVEPDRTGRLTVALAQEPLLAAPVVVSGLERRTRSERLGAERVEATLTVEHPDDAPTALAPTADLTRALSAVAGVRAEAALADAHVQGGASGEHAFLLDGVPVLAPVALGGLVGPFSPFALARVTVHKAGFGAGRGSYLAGVVAAEPVLAPPAGESAALQVDPLSVNARWGGRAGEPSRTEATWAVALRHTLGAEPFQPALAARLSTWSAPDPVLAGALGQDATGHRGGETDTEGYPIELQFADVHAGGRVRFGGLRSLRGALYLARHRFGVDDAGREGTPDEDLYEDAYQWTTATGHLRYEWVVGARTFAHVGAWTSSYRLRRPAVLDAGEGDALHAIRLTGLRAGLDVAAGPRHAVAAALEITNARDGGLDVPGVPASGPAPAPLGWIIAGSVEDRVALGPGAALTLGARLTWLPERQALHAEPRLALRLDGDGALGPWAARVAAGRYLQFLNALDVADGGPAPLLPRVRYWLPLGETERPPEAYHLAVDGLLEPVPGWELAVEAYAKHQPHLLVADYADASDGLLTGADGWAAGAAFRVARATERLRVGATYEIATARQRTPERFGGAWVPAPWDAPHRFVLTLDATPRPRLALSARGEAVLGRAWGFRQAYYDVLEPNAAPSSYTPFDLGAPAEHRLPAFVQVDVSATYTAPLGPAEVQARLGVLNVFARDNVRDRLLVRDAETGTYGTRPRLALPFLPTAALRVTF